jgi:hypothetical protein
MAPQITRGVNSMRIRHRELIAAAVAGSTGFVVQNVFALNPGLASVFPWLAPQAQQWQQYTVHGIRFIWVPIAPTSTAGDVYLVPDYDASDPTPTTETQAADNVDAVVDSCWQDIKCDLSVKGMMGLGPRRFVRPCAMAGDVKTFDVGKFFLCTNNESGTSTIGKLFVEYDFEFFEPQNDPNPDTTPMQTSFFTQHAAESFVSATAKAVAWDTLVYDPLTIGAGSSGTFTPPAGCYRIEATVSASDTANETSSLTLEIFKNGASLTNKAKTFAQASGGASGTAFASTVLAVLPMNGTDTFAVMATVTGTGTLASDADSCELLVSLA